MFGDRVHFWYRFIRSLGSLFTSMGNSDCSFHLEWVHILIVVTMTIIAQAPVEGELKPITVLMRTVFCHLSTHKTTN